MPYHCNKCGAELPFGDYTLEDGGTIDDVKRFCRKCKPPVSEKPLTEAKEKPEQVVEQYCSDRTNWKHRDGCKLGINNRASPLDLCSEYHAKPTPPAKVTFAIEGVPATAGECAAFIQGVQSEREAAKVTEPVEPWIASDVKNLQLHEQTGHGNIVVCILKQQEQIQQLQRKHDALEAEVRELRKDRAG